MVDQSAALSIEPRVFLRKKKLSLEGLKIGSLKLHVLTMEWLANKA